MPGVGAWPCSHPCFLWQISDLNGSREVGCAKPGVTAALSAATSLCALTSAGGTLPPCPTGCPTVPLAPFTPQPGFSQLFVQHAGLTQPMVAQLHCAGLQCCIPLPRELRKRLVLSLSRGDTAGRAAWGAWCQPQHPQPCSEGCQTPKITGGMGNGAGCIPAVWHCS